MKPPAKAQQLDYSDPNTAHWLLECGILHAPVTFRLRAETAADLDVQIERLRRRYGTNVEITPKEHKQTDKGYIAYGAFLA